MNAGRFFKGRLDRDQIWTRPVCGRCGRDLPETDAGVVALCPCRAG